MSRLPPSLSLLRGTSIDRSERSRSGSRFSKASRQFEARDIADQSTPDIDMADVQDEEIDEFGEFEEVDEEFE